METLKRILHLEDNPHDAEIVRRQLAASGLSSEITVAHHRSSFEAALNAGGWDVILCDHNLPGYDGFSALKLAREKHPTVPVIMLSGALSPEDAVECIRAGATDYLLKDRLERLASAVRRGLNETDQLRGRLQAEAALRESEERFRLLAEYSSEVFWFAGLNPIRILYVSPALEKVCGLSPAKLIEEPHSALHAVHPEERARVQAACMAWIANPSTHFEQEFRIVQSDGTGKWVLVTGAAICNQAGEIVSLSGIARDVTDRKESQRRMLRAQRLEAIGTLAGGVAHDLNNALAPIMMGIELLRISYPEESKLIDMLESSARHGADMVRQLLAFAKGAEGEHIPINPKTLIKEMHSIMKGSFPKNIRLQVQHDPDLPTVMADATQLHQVILNLCVNARDAMPNGGTLTLEARRIEIDAAYASSVPEARAGKYVVLRVSDTGTGISPEIFDRIFDPFFSTKGPDKGTGLGLSTVLGIVRGHGGFLQVYSQLGKGSTFAAYFPAERLGSDPNLLATTPIEFNGKGETILFVDDEPAVREVARAVLRRLNFQPLVATDGADALIQAAQNRTDLHGIITDLHMPHMDGLAFVRALRRMLPDIPVIVASGHMEEALASELMSLQVVGRMNKPFTQAELGDALKSLLAQRAARSPGAKLA